MSSAADREARSELASTVRSRISERTAEKIDELLDEVFAAAKAEKKVWVTCTNQRCRRRMHVSIPDAYAAVKAVESLLTQGLGRPQQETPSSGGLTVVRRVVVPGEVGNGDDVEAEEA